MNKFSKLDSTEKKQMDIGGETFFEDDLLIAIENTGIVLVEKTIEDLLIDENSIYIPKVDFNEKQDEYDIENIMKELINVYKDIEVLEEVEKIKSSIKNNNIDYLTYEKIQLIYAEAYVQSRKIMMKCIINKSKDHGEIAKIIKNAIKEIKKIIQ